MSYLYGNNELPINPQKGIELLKKAAESGDTEAPHALAECYEKGEGVAKDPVQARYWAQKAEGMAGKP